MVENRPNYSGGRWSADLASEMVLLVASGGDVRELQRELWACAKRSPERRFHALFDRIWRGDVLLEAWKRVRKNRGAAGVDGLTLAEIEEYGVERLLGELQCALREGRTSPCADVRPPPRRDPPGAPAGPARPVDASTAEPATTAPHFPDLLR